MKRLTGLLLLSAIAAAQDAPLPPVKPFTGASRALALPPDHEWATPWEKSGLKNTPRYDETITWLMRLCDASRQLKMVLMPDPKSAQGRSIWLVIAGDPTSKPTLFAQAGIHSGEIDGKDAGMMLLRDMTEFGKKQYLLDDAAFLFIPILSVDGHERFGPHNRVNQRGPAEMGWRTNAQNLNLNRDYAKLDTAGVRAAIRVINRYKPALYFDIHVTDGADYQYDITWGYNGPHAYSPSISSWLRDHLDPSLNAALKKMGHVPGPLVFATDGKDMTKGNNAPTFGPRFSNGYGDLRHQPTLLVENHSLKPCDQRVFGTYVLMEAALEVLGKQGRDLHKAIEADRERRPQQITLSWKRTGSREVEFLGIEQRLEKSAVSGGDRVVWTGKPVTLKIPLHETKTPALTVKPPKNYWIPVEWRDVIRRLEWHGIETEVITEERSVEVEMYRVTEFELGKAPYEGRVRVSAKFETVRRTQVYPVGSVRVPTDQALGDLAVLLLEPQSADSFFQWGFFPGILQRTEYIENYVIEPLAERMLKTQPKLKLAFEKRLAEDEEFAKSPSARRHWFYERSPYFDQRWRLYPVARE